MSINWESEVFRHKCELTLRRIVSAWMDPHMNPLKLNTNFTREWWDNEMRQAQQLLERKDG